MRGIEQSNVPLPERRLDAALSSHLSHHISAIGSLKDPLTLSLEQLQHIIRRIFPTRAAHFSSRTD